MVAQKAAPSNRFGMSEPAGAAHAALPDSENARALLAEERLPARCCAPAPVNLTGEIAARILADAL